MNKVKILADSTNDLSAALLEKYEIDLIPLSIALGDDSYLDGIEISPDDIYAYYRKAKKLAKSAAATPVRFAEEFRKWTEQGYDVICFTISSNFSVNNSNARLAAEEFSNVYVIDSQNLSTGIGLLILKAAELAEQGVPAAEIAEQVSAMRGKVRASFIIDTLEFLWKGGRCSGVAALGANVLKLKPCIMVVDGKMEVGKKYRGSLESCLMAYVKAQLEGRNDLDLSRIFVTHSGMADEKLPARVEEEVKKYAPFAEVLHTRAGSTVSTHCGPNTLGILFMEK